MCDSRVIGLINALIFSFLPSYRPFNLSSSHFSSVSPFSLGNSCINYTIHQFPFNMYSPALSRILPHSPALSRTLPHSPALSRTLPYSPAPPHTLPFIIHSCVQSSPNASSCFHPYFIFFITFLIPFVLLTPILSSRHLTSKWRSTCTIYDTPSSSPPKKKNKAKQSKQKKQTKTARSNFDIADRLIYTCIYFSTYFSI